MPVFSSRSIANLSLCDNRLQDICYEAIKITDFSVLCGYRDKEDQNRAFEEGTSRAKFGQSAHNKFPSKAVDLAPYPLDWNDIEAFRRLAMVILAIARNKNIKLEWGGDWKSIKDYPHFELKD